MMSFFSPSMQFVFPPAIQEGLAKGVYELVSSNSGVPLSMVRWAKGTANAGQFAGHAIGTIMNDSPLAPITAPVEVGMGLAQMYQVHRGFQKTYQGINQLQASLGVLQSTTAVIGVGVAVTGVLTAVNLYQTLKLREDIKQLKLTVMGGFIDLKSALKDQGDSIIKRIDEVAEDIKYNNHRLILIQAYGKFIIALDRFKLAIKFEEVNDRNHQIQGVLNTLYDALADYSNPHLLEKTCAAGQLRRMECAWAIEQAIIAAYQAQNQLTAVNEHLEQLQNKIHRELLNIINQCSSEEELDFLFPEIARIKIHDCTALKSWQDHTNWFKSLSADEREQLAMLEPGTSEAVNLELPQNDLAVKPLEMQIYEELKQKSHYSALRDQLKLIVKPELRRDYESYIFNKAIAKGLNGLAPKNWEEVPDLTVANLYHYFQVQA
ncbi:hypothetical protein [Planktothrix pseudagardhii]|uniref:Uncharacterized protein n=1 Tax=Planktothrix pseudagardhii TaxID=132604 RepID=A0A9W4G6Z8_9CYAN|nr:hypothetical protein [Planktothrix pseudagardhii]CAD5962489.1 hypothetical protein NO713_03290 [Planktothrix pseudagardhii]